MRTPVLLLTALLFVAPAHAGDLAGLWEVEGTLPSGQAYRGLAALAEAGPDRYRIAGRGRLANGRWVSWQADGTRQAARLEVRHRGASHGLVGAILGPLAGPPPAIVGAYAVAPDEGGFGGAFGPEGAAPTGQVAYRRLPPPTVRFEPDALSLQAGQAAEVVCHVEPRGAAALLRFDGAAVARSSWRNGVRTVTVEPAQAGPTVVAARLGPAGGPVVAELPLTVAGSVLDDVVARVEAAVAAGQAPIVVFDLDDTLFDTRYRVRAILRDYGAEQDEPRLRAVTVRHVRYAIEETLQAAGFSAQEAQGPLGQAIRRYWSRRFFQGASYALDRPIRGAVPFVQRLVAAGAEVAYVSGRREGTRDACLAVLSAAGLPTTTLYLKPPQASGAPKLETDAFKEQVARDELAARGTVIAAFDNEPKNVNAFRRALPDAVVVWLDTIYEPDGPALGERIHTLDDLR